MDDLSGLDWSSTKPTNNAAKPNPMMNSSQGSFYPPIRPTPSPQASGLNTPLSAQGSGVQASRPAAQKPAADSFSNLVNFGGAKSNANLSLRERQDQLEAEKRRKAEEQKKQMQAQYGSGQFWDTLEKGSAGASRTVSPAAPMSSSSGLGAIPPPAAGQNGRSKDDDDDDDLFAAFHKDTKVDNASHYPPPPDLADPRAWAQSSASPAAFGDDDDPFGLNQIQPKAAPQPPPQPAPPAIHDDDPFGLNQMQPKTASQRQPVPPTNNDDDDDDDDDFLGDLGKPVEEVRRKAQVLQPRPEPGKPIEGSDSDSDSEPDAAPPTHSDDPFDKAVAELVEMGFTPENARRGLTESGGGLNIQAAVGWLLDNAHKKTREKPRSRDPQGERSRGRGENERSSYNASPAWMRDGSSEPPSRADNMSPNTAANDLQQRAAAMGTSFFKTANSLWKTGQKQVQKAVAEFNQEAGDPSQPKWMRSAQQDMAFPPEKQRTSATDEAMMLDSGMRPERSTRAPREAAQPGPSRREASRDGSRAASPALASRPAAPPAAAPRWQQQQQASQPPVDPRARLHKQTVEEQSAQAYVSPARRKKTTPQPQPVAEAEPDLLFNSTAPPTRPTQRVAPSSPAAPGPAKPVPPASRRPITPRPAAPVRQIPSVAPAIMQASHKNRQEGTAHFKLGDFDAAHTAYTKSLQGIPQAHPLCIVLLTNRSLTALKTGSPKQAVDDADKAVSIIGPTRGEGEKVTVGEGEQRDMKELYGKALSRKAEALEQMEKWAEASNVWQQCVEAGVGGSTAAAGRQRCQKALAPKPKATPKPVQRPKPSAASDLGPQKNSDAVEKLRAANKAAEQADDERFALSEKVDARISLWRDGKRDNLRALLGSLDQVLWEGSGWKKVGMHELVMANRVKIHYMKAIAKTHPDKLPQDAPTEVQLIAATVFATLNESWDKFKSENGL